MKKSRLFNLLAVAAIAPAAMGTGFAPRWFDAPFRKVEFRPDAQPSALKSLDNKLVKADRSAESTRPPYRLGENSPLKPPFCETFDNVRTGMEHDDFDRYFQVIDSNNDNRSWGLYNYAEAIPYGRSAYLLYPINTPKADDWLITRAIRLEKGKYYRVTMDAGLYLNTTPDKPQVFEVKTGNYNDADGLTTSVIPATEINSKDFRHVEGWITPRISGTYYLGIHAISPTYADYYNYLFLDNIAVDAALEGVVPAGVTDIHMTNDPNGGTKVNISFAAPTKTLAGDALTALESITITREGMTVKTFANPRPGETLTLTDDPGLEGLHDYEFVARNSEGDGAKVEFRHSAGIAAPVMPVITAFEEVENNQVRLAWTAPEEDVNGNAINPEAITYTINEFVDGLPVEVVSGLSATEYVFAPTLGAGGQTLAIATVTATVGGKSSTPVNTEYVAVGDPYPLPHHNSFTLDDYYAYVLAYDLKEGIEWRMLDDFSDPNAQDGDNGYVCMISSTPDASCELQTGKIDLRGTESPMLSFYTYVYADDENRLDVNVIDPTTGERTRVSSVVMNTLGRGGWKNVTLSLAKFAGKIIRLGLEGTIVTHGQIPVDNLSIYEAPLSDLAVSELSFPAYAEANTPFDVTVTIKNNARRESGVYTVSLLDGNRVVATAEGKPIPAFGGAMATLTTQFSPVSPASTTYTVRIDNNGDEVAENNVSDPFEIVYLAAVEPVVTDLQGTEDAEGGNVTLTWSAPDLSNAAPLPTTDSFEDYDEFATKFGNWLTYDGDKGFVGGFNGLEMPIDLTQQSFWIMHQSAVYSFLPTHSGSAVAAAMYGFNSSNRAVPNDDWLISPELYGGHQAINFWARSLTEDYGCELIEIYYSTGGTDPADFKPLSETIEVPAVWTQFYAPLPEGTRHFAVRYVSDNIYLLLLDDFTFIPKGEPRSLELVGYNVYRNGELLNPAPLKTPGFSTTRSDVYDEFYVTAVYNGTESAGSNMVSFGVSAIDGIDADTADQPAEFYNLQGIRVPASSLTPGIYICRQGRKATKIIVR